MKLLFELKKTALRNKRCYWVEVLSWRLWMEAWECEVWDDEGGVVQMWKWKEASVWYEKWIAVEKEGLAFDLWPLTWNHSSDKVWRCRSQSLSLIFSSLPPTKRGVVRTRQLSLWSRIGCRGAFSAYGIRTLL